MELEIIIGIISVGAIFLTFLLNLIFNKKRYIKYIPPIIMAPFMIYNFITMYTAPSEGFQALGRFVMGLFLLTAIAVSLITSIIIDLINKKNSANI